MLSNPGKLLILTQVGVGQALHAPSLMHHPGHLSALAGTAEIDDARAATTASTIAEEKRIFCDSCNMGLDDSEEDSRDTAGSGWL
ncbi:hypothetical protein DFJ58DRAFT_780105 [Suillus subalutaceus]|uniref:uncharacterized protein n=1 Tax=Suillus subalutaceus TaxID=48586 RepID=UPI001B8680B6|nr:uncharacterized protein DFJ58DRAFT_780105 [Suillus subalutaceus]KAG1859531.1 hypothetical protein DFJ58DRAFT_780105 [Suillus subalutaceus]